MSRAPRVIYAGTPEFAVPTLEALLDAAAGVDVVAVYTQPDRPAGRGRSPRPSPVKAVALEHGLPVRQPESLRTQAERSALAALAPDLMVVAAYGLILPRAILDIPRRGCVNIHASLLPRWRGAAPIQRALIAGDTSTGVCLMAMTPGLDAGPVIACREVAIGARDTAADLHDRLAREGASLLTENLADWLSGGLIPRPQAQSGVTHAAKLDKSEADLDWGLAAVALDRRIRAFDPWPVARVRAPSGEWLRLWRAEPVAGECPPGARPGAVTAVSAAGIDVVTGDGLLRLLEVQRPGRRRQRVGEFLNGQAIVPGDCFGSEA